MNIPFKTPGLRAVTIAIAFMLGAAYVGLAATQLLASWFGHRVELASLKRAAWLDRGNAEYFDNLGRYYDLVARDPISAIAEYKAAVHLNPHSARYWFDLASSYQILGDTANQTSALEHAIQADATTPDVAWEAANLYLVQGQNEKALNEFRVVIANDPPLAGSALQFCWRIQPDVDSLLRYVVPHRADSLSSFLALLESKQETSGALKVWDALIKTNEPFEQRFVFEFIPYLVQHKEADAAALAWRQAATRFGLTSYLPSSSNLVVNGNFDFKVLNAGFDWQYQKQPSVSLTLDPSDFHAGRRSLLITFDGPGISDAGIYQLIAVQPNTKYDFTGYFKTGEMEGAGGPHLTIQDMYTQAVYYESDELKDAGFWKSATGDFTTGADCKLILLHIRRLPAGSPMRGKLWVGDFHLVPKPS